MTKNDVIENMLELALWLADLEDGSNTIELKVDKLNMYFAVWQDEESE